MTITLAKWALDEYHQMINAGVLLDRQVEFLNGEVVEMSPESPEHAYRNTTSADLLRRKLGDRAWVRDAKPITLPEAVSEPEPDIAVVEALGEVYATRHPYPENVYLLIEYAYSSLAKDTDAKRKLYARSGIQDYWVINLKDRHVIVYRNPQNEDYQSVERLTQGTIVLLAFPDVEISVNSIL
ncbi:Uma2 family endonuclease [Phormidesmis priestleyi ULC007]|uniref:Uma2 family endonuclease n=1 Tax=Phormidesmis priestleyi ULC007 TaxID=1920490 RepID=A0A2T1DL61_9CYAN|nr:Uma2 family endonuclease [Phormidesmis priestleyi]PSB21212.1 Uma2 family endonuclease [Phormidesmis priestleyi ULC007]PZO51260.1 MAG: Uma2 family endonuclease [Phormidesmis priestleyi]